MDWSVTEKVTGRENSKTKKDSQIKKQRQQQNNQSTR
jgi:hypothetical protein